MSKIKAPEPSREATASLLEYWRKLLEGLPLDDPRRKAIEFRLQFLESQVEEEE